MLTKKTILQCLITLKIDSSIEISEQDLKEKTNIIYEQCKELRDETLCDDDFKKATNQIIREGIELYGKLPKTILFLEKLGFKKPSPKEQASIEAERIIEAAHYPSTTLFDNEFTNAAVIAYGGLGAINYDHFSSYNPNPTKREWLKKELVEVWLSCQADNKRKNTPFFVEGSNRITFVGDKVKCQNMLESSKQLEAPDKKIEVISNIGNQFPKKKFDFEKTRRMAFAACESSPYYNE